MRRNARIGPLAAPPFPLEPPAGLGCSPGMLHHHRSGIVTASRTGAVSPPCRSRWVERRQGEERDPGMEGGTVRLDDELEAESPRLPDQPGRLDQVAVMGLLQHLPGRPCPGEVDVVGVRRLDIEGTALGDPGAGALEMLDRRRYVLDAARGVDVCVVFPGPVRTPMLEAALGRPIAPATRVGRCLERGWFMDPSVCVAKAPGRLPPGPGQRGRRPGGPGRGPPAPAGHPQAGRLGPAPPHRRLSRPGGVEAGQRAGVAWNPQIRP
jgi:hypothetical protein